MKACWLNLAYHSPGISVEFSREQRGVTRLKVETVLPMPGVLPHAGERRTAHGAVQ